MLYPYSYEYIKYLNDENSYGMTYDQWKNKNNHDDSDKCNRCGNGKDFCNICPKCKY
ncbi:hypothetical protein J2S10_003367 [Neobacillus ginsengisoli]|uniref:Uncharacterized protein n=1 Tax=Neobacillus ginsengisoli TaxID=904295 RepID=A0ABT9XXE9_9BACI|nr:hypothetical protein [Neobacillus ginsengisoli]